jgi:hypothetical protein
MISKDKTLIIIAILVGVVAFAAIIGFIGQGNVRHVSIFWQERVEQTVAFEDVDGKVQLQGISGVGGEPNPYLITRTNFAYILTVINNGTTQHRLYIEGLNARTDLLEPGQQETLTIYPDKEGVYKYFDERQWFEHLGFLEVKTVVHSDEFTGIWRDLI